MLCLGVFMETRRNDAILAEEQEESRLNTCRQKPTLKCSLGSFREFKSACIVPLESCLLGAKGTLTEKGMSETIAELKGIYDEVQSFIESLGRPEIVKPLEALEKSASEVGKAWGHSWLGYQSRVYYEELKPPPAGAHFSSEWGFQGFSMGTRGAWVPFP